MSAFLKLNSYDLLKGLIMAFLGAALGALYQLLTTTGILPTTGAGWWQMILLPGCVAFIAYLTKNIFSGNAAQTKSVFGSINWMDFFKGLFTATLGAITGGIYQMISTGSFCGDWQCWWTKILLPGAIVFVGYLIKNFFSNSTGDTFIPENK